MTSSDTNSSPQEHPMTDATPLASEQITQALTIAVDALTLYADPTGYFDAYNEQFEADAPQHPGLAAKAALEKIAALSATPAPSDQDASQAQGEVQTTVRQTDAAEADYGERFLVAHVSKDGSIVGIDHPCDAVWADVMTAHVALRNRINERIDAQDGCPFKPRTAPLPKTIDQTAKRASEATGLAVSVRRSNADVQSHAPMSYYIHVEAPSGRTWTTRAGMNRDECKEALFMLASVAALSPAPGATAQDGVEPFGYWIEQKGAEPLLLRKPAYIPEPSNLRTVTPLYATPGFAQKESNYDVDHRDDSRRDIPDRDLQSADAPVEEQHRRVATPTPTIPAGMVAWNGGDSAPEDWDGGPTYFRMGRMSERGEGPLSDLKGQWCGIGNWQHNNGKWDVIAYTPLAAAPKQAEQQGVERWKSMDSAPRDGSEFWALTDDVHGTDLSPFVSKCAWHPDAGFCTDELREPILWRPFAALNAPTGAVEKGEAK